MIARGTVLAAPACTVCAVGTTAGVVAVGVVARRCVAAGGGDEDVHAPSPQSSVAIATATA